MKLIVILLCAVAFILAAFIAFAARTQEPSAMKKSMRLRVLPLLLAGAAGMFFVAVSGF